METKCCTSESSRAWVANLGLKLFCSLRTNTAKFILKLFMEIARACLSSWHNHQIIYIDM